MTKFTPEQEFDMMRLVMDKILWIATIILIYGLYVMWTGGIDAIVDSFLIIVLSAAVFIIFIVMVSKHYEWTKRKG